MERSSAAFRVYRSPLCAAPSPHFLRAFAAAVALAPDGDGASRPSGEIGTRRCAAAHLRRVHLKSVFHSTFEEYFIIVVENCVISRVAIQKWNSKTRKVPSEKYPQGLSRSAPVSTIRLNSFSASPEILSSSDYLKHSRFYSNSRKLFVRTNM